MKYTNSWNDLTKRIGYWVDMEDPYITYTTKYIESVWWLIKEIYKKFNLQGVYCSAIFSNGRYWFKLT